MDLGDFLVLAVPSAAAAEEVVVEEEEEEEDARLWIALYSLRLLFHHRMGMAPHRS